MTLSHYLAHRRRYETLAIAGLLLLIASILATSIGIERIRQGTDPGWARAWAAELTAAAAVGVLLPILFRVLDGLNLSWRNLRWRALWLLPVWLVFSLLHIGLFTAAREVLWAMAGRDYDIGPIGLGLLYELRKDVLVFISIVAVFYSYRFILDRLQGEARFLSDEGAAAAADYRRQFLVKMLDREYLVRVDDIRWVQSAGNYVLLHCDGRQYPMRETLKKLAARLDPAQFQRVHRTAIVNLDFVAALNDGNETSLVLRTGEAIPVSKTYLPGLRQRLKA